MQSLKGGTEALAHLDHLEADYYDLQLQLYEVQFEILKCEELLLTAQLESIRRLMSGAFFISVNANLLKIIFLIRVQGSLWEWNMSRFFAMWRAAKVLLN